MSSLITAVFKATIGLLVNKGRDAAADKLRDGDVTDQKFRGLIVREIEDVKSQLKGLARKDLLTSISFFKEGIELLYVDLFGNEMFRSEYCAMKQEATTAATAHAETFSLAMKMPGKLELIDLDESALRTLSKAKKRFEDARREATRAFSNEALKLSDRMLAMQYRVMATILETVDKPEDALTSCRVCIEELHSLSAVKTCFMVELKKGLWAVFSKEERRKIISTVCQVNRGAYDVALLVGRRGEALMWPCIECGEDKIYPLRDSRVAKVLEKVRMDHFCVGRSFGQQGEKEHIRRRPVDIATSADGHFVIADNGFLDKGIILFDSDGTFLRKFCPLKDDDNEKLINIWDVATDGNSNIYALVTVERNRKSTVDQVMVFNSTCDVLRKFIVNSRMKRGMRQMKEESPHSIDVKQRLTVTNTKVLVMKRTAVDVHEHDGEFVRTFGEEILKGARDIAADAVGQVIILDSRGGPCVHVFTEDGQHLSKFNINHEAYYNFVRVACHPAGEHIIVGGEDYRAKKLAVVIYTKDGECQGTVTLYDEWRYLGHGLKGITATIEGRIALIYDSGRAVAL